MSESSYKDGEVVWVKWGNVWWPGEVWSDSRVPEDIITSLRKPVIAFVKFFQEDSFEFVRSPNNICQYNADKKMEFIKKGMDKYRSNNKIMTNFPADVVKAEQLTNGNVNILNQIETPTKSSKGAASSSVTDSPKKSTQSTTVTSSASPSTPVVSKKAVGSYNSSVKVQNTTSPVQKSNDKKLTCTMCNFSTDRMNLLMMHIKNHSLTILSRVNSSSSSSLEVRRSIVPKVSSRNKELDDGIAEDVRKIKESMKETTNTPTTSAKKTRTSAVSNTAAKSTPKVKQSRQRKDKKVDNNKDNKDEEDNKASLVISKEKETVVDEINKPKSSGTGELKNELLADWLDEEDVKVEDNKIENELIKTPASAVEKSEESPVKSAEKTNEVSRSIRNIPKKQRVSEIYIQPEKVELSNSIIKTDTESSTMKQKEETIVKKEEIVEQKEDVIATVVQKQEVSTTVETSSKKSQKANKRKYAASDSSSEPEKKKMSEDSDEKILMATAELLNETEVPKISNVQSPSTFHTNDIDKRYLPPKERNKRIFRARNSPEVTTKNSTNQPIITSTQIVSSAHEKSDEKEKISTEIIETKVDDKSDTGHGTTHTNNEDPVQLSPIINSNKSDRQELMLPHKKKQSSRLLTATTEKLSPVNEAPKQPTAVVKEQSVTAPNVRSNSNNSKKNRKSTDSQNSNDVEMKIAADDLKPITQSPLREIVDTTKNSSPCDTTTADINRCQKRQRSKDSQPDLDSTNELQPEPKKLHTLELPRKIIACSSEAICITSKGTLSVARRDSIKTTTASSIVVTSQVIISEATKQPIVSSQSSSIDMISSSSSPKQQSISSPTTTVSLSQQTLKNALKIPKENMEEMKKQGLLTIENNRPKLTPKGRQKFKEFQNEQNNLNVSTSSSSQTSLSTTSSSTSLTSCDEIHEKESDSQSESQRTNLEESPEKQLKETVTEIVTEEAQKSKSISNENNDGNGDIKKSIIDDEKCEDEDLSSTCEAEKSNNKNVEEEQKEEIEKEEDKITEESQDNKKTNDNADNNVNNNNEVSSNNSTQKEESEVSLDSQTDITNDVTITAEEKFEKSTKESDNDTTKDDSLIESDEPKTTQSESQSMDESSQEIESSDKSQTVIENGKDDDDEKESDISQDSGSTGLIALQAETFGGPPNCFYLCRQVEDRYEPVDNQILVLNAQNALVPYEGIISDLGLASSEVVQDNLSAYSQLSPNSNIIINTPGGQKIELSQFTIMALQEQADENGIASIDLAGESLELNITAILEAIQAQQGIADANDSIPPGAMLLENSDAPLIIDSEIPLDVHHPSVATQVSETLSKPIMSTTVAPEIVINPAKSINEKLNIDDSLASIGVTTQRQSLELPITVTNPKIVETVNHRKLAATLGADIVTESFVIQQSTDNGSDD